MSRRKKQGASSGGAALGPAAALRIGARRRSSMSTRVRMSTSRRPEGDRIDPQTSAARSHTGAWRPTLSRHHSRAPTSEQPTARGSRALHDDEELIVLDSNQHTTQNPVDAGLWGSLHASASTRKAPSIALLSQPANLLEKRKNDCIEHARVAICFFLASRCATTRASGTRSRSISRGRRCGPFDHETTTGVL
ncbi:hypothetical protein SDC9_61378 [bioreactor metagenome]|uniref:Uncharacterized protein n=1 Tax=bioreactor metagenome TaxID=1076179 RepID=A0A644XLA1_9ZZZZ